MKTLILSCNTGEGHNSCAKAIKEYYDSKGEVCVIKDGLEFISPKVSRFMSWGHSYIYRHIPWLFRYGYSHTEKHPGIFHDGSGIYQFLTQGTERMYAYIQDGGYDAVICTHVFTALMLTDLQKTHSMKLATCYVSTDYTCSPSTKDSNLDYYFIPDGEFAADFKCVTITEDKMIPSGIPVRQMFYQTTAKEEAKKRMGVRPEHKHMIMMCGSMGCGPMKALLRKLSKCLPQAWELTVICGKNEKLARKLMGKYESNQKIHIREFVEDIAVVMDSADLYLTKPGGLSVTEAQAKALPMVLIDAVAGCEAYNRIHFVGKGCAKTGKNNREITEVCLALMESEDARDAMEAAFAQTEKRNSAQIIYEKMKHSKEQAQDLKGATTDLG